MKFFEFVVAVLFIVGGVFAAGCNDEGGTKDVPAEVDTQPADTNDAGDILEKDATDAPTEDATTEELPEETGDQANARQFIPHASMLAETRTAEYIVMEPMVFTRGSTL